MYKSLLIFIVASVVLVSANTASAKSQCSGLSSSACSSDKTCTWRKLSVDKNGKKTKAHCRALPGQAKSVSKTKSANKLAESSKTKTKSTTSSLKAKAKSKTNKSSSAKTKVKTESKKTKKSDS